MSVSTCEWIFFPRSLDPVLNRGEGNENPVIPPEMPACRPIRQAVFDDDTHGKLDDVVGIVGVRSGDVRRIDLKVFITLATIVNGISEMNIDGTTGGRIAEMTEFPLPYFMPGRGSLAERTAAFFRRSRALSGFGRRKIVWIDNSFGRVGQVFTRSGHGVILLEFKVQGDNMPHFSI